MGNVIPLVVWLCCILLGAVRIRILLTQLPLNDFITYWAAGHLFLNGSNPYFPDALFALERAHGWPLPHPLVMLCPPWALPLAALLAAVPVHDARVVWLLISIALDVFSACGLWMYFGGGKRQLWIALLVALTFLPMGSAEHLGQITPIVLASITAFLLLQRSHRDFMAGAVLLGFGFKPHLLYLVWIALLLWVVQTRRWKIIAGAAATYVLALSVAILYNRQALHYFGNTYGAAINTVCGIGGALRTAFGMQHVWLQYLPSVIGVLWLIGYWRRNRHAWSWRDHLPLLLIISLASAPYCWAHDFILIMPALIYLAARQAYRYILVLISYAAVQLLLASVWFTVWAGILNNLWILFYWFANSRISSAGTKTPAPTGTSEDAYPLPVFAYAPPVINRDFQQ
ncbi:MAG: DUF2029 domain-containing protein [Silvibacterium sp.]|nr:DUF2029 domain-containing protein [Silvibacterium sp.]